MTSAWWTDAVDHGGGDGLVAEDLTPAGECQVGCQDDRGVFVAGRDELEEQVRGVLFEREVADLVDLCRCRHRSTYADDGIMPICPRVGVVSAVSVADMLTVLSA